MRNEPQGEFREGSFRRRYCKGITMVGSMNNWKERVESTCEVHPTAYLAPGVYLKGEVTIGEECSIWHNSVINGDCSPVVIGKRTNLQELCCVHVGFDGVGTTIGDEVTVGHSAILHGCTIGDRCLIGMGAIIMDGAVVGEDSVVGAGAVITEGTIIPPGSIVVGIPAKIRGEVKPEHKANAMRSVEHYIRQANEHRLKEESL